MTLKQPAARLVIAGTGGDSGKTVVSMGLAALWRQRGNKVAVFKKGPDYIDAAWLTFASGRTARNLDTYMMGAVGALDSFRRHRLTDGFNLIEGNRGLYDGFDHRGTHSTAALAKLLRAPVILILDVTKMTRTAAAVVLGCRHLDPEVNIAGVILNRVAGARHEGVVRRAVEEDAGVPVWGVLPRLRDAEPLLPDRHLGLVTPAEHPDLKGVLQRITNLVEQSVDVERLLESARQAPEMEALPDPAPEPVDKTVRIAVFRDSAFTFYYPENLEALQAAGADLVAVSSLEDERLPDCDGLYIGGGFPETHAERLARNRALMESVKEHARAGLPIYAECGGLIYLCRSLKYAGRTFPMADVFPVDLEMQSRPQGHGYMEVIVDKSNPFFPVGSRLRGHEFHYSRAKRALMDTDTIFDVRRGYGTADHRDGLQRWNTVAGYLHLHAAGAAGWAEAFVEAAGDYQRG